MRRTLGKIRRLRKTKIINTITRSLDGRVSRIKKKKNTCRYIQKRKKKLYKFGRRLIKHILMASIQFSINSTFLFLCNIYKKNKAIFTNANPAEMKRIVEMKMMNLYNRITMNTKIFNVTIVMTMIILIIMTIIIY